MAPNAAPSAILTLIRVTAFGLGASYGGHRLASLKHRKAEEDEERAKKDIQEKIERAIEEREKQREAALRPPPVHTSGTNLMPADKYTRGTTPTSVPRPLSEDEMVAVTLSH